MDTDQTRRRHNSFNVIVDNNFVESLRVLFPRHLGQKIDKYIPVKLRRARDEATVVQNLVRFMTVFYSGAELSEFSVRLVAEARNSTNIRQGLERVIAETPGIGNIFPRKYSLCAANAANEYSGRTQYVAIAARLIRQAITLGQRGEPEAALASYDEVVERFGNSEDRDSWYESPWRCLTKALRKDNEAI